MKQHIFHVYIFFINANPPDDAGSLSYYTRVMCMYTKVHPLTPLYLVMQALSLPLPFPHPTLSSSPHPPLPPGLSSFPSLGSNTVSGRVCDLNLNMAVYLPSRLLGCPCPESLVLPSFDSWLCSHCSSKLEVQSHHEPKLNSFICLDHLYVPQPTDKCMIRLPGKQLI